MAFIFYGCIFIWGILGGCLGWTEYVTPDNHVSHYVGQSVQLEGRIDSGSVCMREGYVSLQIEVERVDNTPCVGKIRLGVTQAATAKFPTYGQLAVRGELKAIRGLANPGSFDTELAARIQDIGGRMSVEVSQLTYSASEPTWTDKLSTINQTAKDKVYAVMAPQDAAILIGMVLGGYEGIDSTTVRNFSTTGLVHILSVSGSHIALLVGFVLSLCHMLKLPRQLTVVLAAVIIIFYTLLCGFSPPVLRSLLMGLAMLVGLSLGRSSQRGTILGATAFAMLCYRPLWLWDVGFQLSFLSTAGLIYLLPPCRDYLKRYLPELLADTLAVAVAAQAAALPLLVHYFHQISLSSLAANLIVVPLVEFVLVVALVGLVLSILCSVLGSFCLVLAASILGISLRLTDYLAAIPWAVVTVGALPAATALIYYLGLWLALGLPPMEDLSKNLRRLGVLCCCGGFALYYALVGLLPRPFTVYFLDVGQGDCAVVQTPEDEIIVIDTGGLRGNFNTGERIIVPFLRYLGAKQVDVLLLSHGHHDHAGGAARLATMMPITTVMLPYGETGEDVEQLLHIVQGKSQVEYLETGEQFSVGKCIINVVSCPKEIVGDDSNERSALVQLTYGAAQVFFTGDATADAELAVAGQDIGSAVLKVSHHGSKHSTVREFVRAVQPQTAIISVGADNRFGHPGSSTLETLAQEGAAIYRTDTMGALKVTFTDAGHLVYSYRQESDNF